MLNDPLRSSDPKFVVAMLGLQVLLGVQKSIRMSNFNVSHQYPGAPIPEHITTNPFLEFEELFCDSYVRVGRSESVYYHFNVVMGHSLQGYWTPVKLTIWTDGNKDKPREFHCEHTPGKGIGYVLKECECKK